MWDPSTRWGRKVLLRKLGLREDVADAALSLFLAGVQRAHGLTPSGVADAPTLDLLGPAADEAAIPEWFAGSMTRDSMRARYGLPEEGLRRLEGQHGHLPGSLEGEPLALLLEHWA